MKIHFGNIKRNVAAFFSAAWRQQLGKVLLCLCGALVITAAAIGIYLYNQGNAAEANAGRLLADYRQAQASQETAQPYQPGASEQAGHPVAVTVGGYQILGTLDIQKIGQTLPVISQTTDKALTVSACYYVGALPGEQGNMVITGHDYADGSIFGSLNKLTVGDSVTLTGTDGKTYGYSVFAMDHINPDDLQALDDTTYANELSLLTCENNGNGRLLVRCREVSA